MIFRNVSRWVRPVHFGLSVIIVVFTGMLIAACNTLLPDNPQVRSPDILDQVQSVDLLPRTSQPSGPATLGRSKDPRAAVYNGSAQGADGNTAVTLEGAEHAASGDGYDLNFENAPVTTVAKVILGDILGVGYIIDPRVQGTVTLTSGRPVSKGDVLYALESALRVSNVALVRDTNGYRLVPGNEAIGSGRLDVVTANERPQAGFGISVVPLRFVSAPTITKLLENFATKQGAVRVDSSRNMIIIQGTGPERRTAVETVLSFDTDWMRGQTVGIFPVKHSTPEPIITEIEKIMDSGEGGLSHNLVKLQPIGRLNAILVVTQKPAMLKTAETWIHRLDNSEVANTGVKVYRVRYGDARLMAQLLNDMFGGGSSGTIDSASSQIAPGGGVTTTSSGAGAATPMTPVERLTGGPPLSQQLAAASSAPGAGSRALSSPRAGSTGGAGAILPGVRITADVANNSLLIFATEENYQIIEGALRQIDRPQLQVAFDATIAEVNLNNNLTYGVQFFLKSSNVGAPPNTGSVVNTIGKAVLGRVLPGFNVLVGSEAFPQVVINALNTITDVKILSNPSLVVVDNGTATLQVGDQVPIQTGQATVLTTSNTVVNTINYQNTGIILRVIPRVSFNNTVKLDIEQEISNVSPTSVGSLTPTISQRKVKSTINVADGQTVLLAGLISEVQNKSRNGVPVLDQLPGVLGDAFSSTSKTVQRTELIIFIRPQVIRDSVDAHLVAEELRAKLKDRIGTVTPKSQSLFGVPITAQ